MSCYRSYRLGFDGHILSVDEIECENDASALARAWGLLCKGSHSAVELWQGIHLIGRIDRYGAPPPTALAGPAAALRAI